MGWGWGDGNRLGVALGDAHGDPISMRRQAKKAGRLSGSCARTQMRPLASRLLAASPPRAPVAQVPVAPPAPGPRRIDALVGGTVTPR